MKIDVENYYRKYGPMVLRRCRQILGDEHQAKDAMQEVFVQLIRKQETIRDEYPSSLLYRMATNTCLNMIRSDKRRQEYSKVNEFIYQAATDDEYFESLDARSLLDKIFSKEKASTKLIAIYHFVDGMTLEETAREVKMSRSGVRKRLRLLKERIGLKRNYLFNA